MGFVCTKSFLIVRRARRHPAEVDSVGKGNDCGISLADVVDIRMGDIIQCVSIVRRPLRSVKIESGLVASSKSRIWYTVLISY